MPALRPLWLTNNLPRLRADYQKDKQQNKETRGSEGSARVNFGQFVQKRITEVERSNQVGVNKERQISLLQWLLKLYREAESKLDERLNLSDKDVDGSSLSVEKKEDLIFDTMQNDSTLFYLQRQMDREAAEDERFAEEQLSYERELEELNTEQDTLQEKLALKPMPSGRAKTKLERLEELRALEELAEEEQAELAELEASERELQEVDVLEQQLAETEANKDSLQMKLSHLIAKRHNLDLPGKAHRIKELEKAAEAFNSLKEEVSPISPIRPGSTPRD